MLAPHQLVMSSTHCLCGRLRLFEPILILIHLFVYKKLIHFTKLTPGSLQCSISINTSVFQNKCIHYLCILYLLNCILAWHWNPPVLSIHIDSESSPTVRDFILSLLTSSYVRQMQTSCTVGRLLAGSTREPWGHPLKTSGPMGRGENQKWTTLDGRGGRRHTGRPQTKKRSLVHIGVWHPPPPSSRALTLQYILRFERFYKRYGPDIFIREWGGMLVFARTSLMDNPVLEQVKCVLLCWTRKQSADSPWHLYLRASWSRQQLILTAQMQSWPTRKQAADNPGAMLRDSWTASVQLQCASTIELRT